MIQKSKNRIESLPWINQIFELNNLKPGRLWHNRELSSRKFEIPDVFSGEKALAWQHLPFCVPSQSISDYRLPQVSASPPSHPAISFPLWLYDTFKNWSSNSSPDGEERDSRKETKTAYNARRGYFSGLDFSVQSIPTPIESLRWRLHLLHFRMFFEQVLRMTSS